MDLGCGVVLVRPSGSSGIHELLSRKLDEFDPTNTLLAQDVCLSCFGHRRKQGGGMALRWTCSPLILHWQCVVAYYMEMGSGSLTNKVS